MTARIDLNVFICIYVDIHVHVETHIYVCISNYITTYARIDAGAAR